MSGAEPFSSIQMTRHIDYPKEKDSDPFFRTRKRALTPFSTPEFFPLYFAAVEASFPCRT